MNESRRFGESNSSCWVTLRQVNGLYPLFACSVNAIKNLTKIRDNECYRPYSELNKEAKNSLQYVRLQLGPASSNESYIACILTPKFVPKGTSFRYEPFIPSEVYSHWVWSTPTPLFDKFGLMPRVEYSTLTRTGSNTLYYPQEIRNQTIAFKLNLASPGTCEKVETITSIVAAECVSVYCCISDDLFIFR